MKMWAALLAAVMCCTSCKNPWTDFYRGNDAHVMKNVELPGGNTQIYSSDNFQRDVPGLLRKGFVVVGETHFTGPSNQNVDGPLRAQAEKVGASAILVSSNYSHTVQGVMPLIVPTTSTSYSSGTATAYGPGGTVNAYGSGVTTTYGTTTQMTPFSISRSNFDAVFFVKQKSTRMGIVPKELDQESRRRLGSNAGILVSLLVEGSPAYRADMLEGDILIQLGDDRIESIQHYYSLLDKYEGVTVKLIGFRGEKPIEKSAMVNRAH